nr:hypothetical protein pPsy0462c_00049 [Pseudomonas syringae]
MLAIRLAPEIEERLPDRRKTCLSGVGGIRAVATTG